MMTKHLAGAALGVLLCAPAALAQYRDFQWSGNMDPGQTLTVRGINGRVEAEAAAGGTAGVTARKRGHRSDPDSVDIRVVEHGDGVTICALYPNRRGKQPNECLPFGEGSSSNEDNDIVVDFLVRVPYGVHFIGKTVNGNVEAEGLDGDVEGTTVNGQVEISTTGLASARTVNGSIRVSMGRSDWDGELEFQTVNGGIQLAFPADLSTAFKASTLNGDIRSDFDLNLSGKQTRGYGWRPGRRKTVRGIIGSKDTDRDLRVETVNGSIRIRRDR